MESSTHTVSATGSVKTKLSRLAYLDVLRGIAIALVLIEHISERTFHTVTEFSYQRIQLGQMGVTIFFACSGFIIPVSLERAKSLSKFWVARIFRLYPIYLFTLALFYLGIRIGWFDNPFGPHFSNWFWNATMQQQFAGHQDILGVAWTLHWEYIFYFMVSALFVVRLLKYPVFLSLTVNAALIFGSLFVDDLTHTKTLPPIWFAIAAMFHGTVWNKWADGKVSTKQLWAVVSTTAAAAFFIMYTNTAFKGDLSGGKNGTGSFPVMMAAFWGAMIIFGVVVYMGKHEKKIPLVTQLSWLGRISYSVYLLHALVLDVITFGRSPAGDALEAATILVVTLAISVLTYRWIEQPFIDIGRWVSKALFGVKKVNPIVRDAIEAEEQVAL